MFNEETSIVVSDEICGYITPLTQEQRFLLEKNLIEEGCRDPIIVWRRSEMELVIVDGHNRYQICKKHNLEINYVIKDFDDVNHIKLWMIENQIGRRNLSQDQLSYYRGLKYLSLRKRRGGFENIRSKGKKENTTSDKLSNEFSVSSSTIKRDAKYAEVIDLIENLKPDLKQKILTGELNVKKRVLLKLLEIKNQDEILNVLEEISRDKLIREGQRTKYIERVKIIKGMMISTINRVVERRRQEDILELKALIMKLECELFKKEEVRPLV